MFAQLEIVLGQTGKRTFVATGTALAIIVTALLAYQYYRIDALITKSGDAERYRHISVQAAAVLGIHVLTMLTVPVDALYHNGHNLWLAWAIQSGGAVATILNAILAAQVQSIETDDELKSVLLASVSMQVVANMLILAWIFNRIN